MNIKGNVFAMCAVPILGLGTINSNSDVEDDKSLYAGVTSQLSDVLAESACKLKGINIEETLSKVVIPYEKVYKYANAYVNFRTQPNTNSEIIRTIKGNTVVEHIEDSNDWSYVLIGETYGYIMSQYLSDDEIPVSKLNRWDIELNPDETELLARIVWLEARGEKQTGREAVVEVIFNRIASGIYGDDLYSVLSSKGQFTSWSRRNNAKPTENEYKAVNDVLYGCTSILENDYIYFSTGRSNGRNFVKIGNHWFGRR